MKPYFFIALCAVLFPAFTSAQQPTPLRDLTVGNRFVYVMYPLQYQEPKRPDTVFRYYEQVLRDTSINGKTFAVVYNSYERLTHYERSNDTATFVWKDGKETLQYNWNVKNGDNVNLSFLGLQYQSIASTVDRGISQPDGNIITDFTLSNYIYNNSSAYIAIGFVKPFGITQADIYTQTQKNGLRREFDRHIQGAIINGIISPLFKDTSTQYTISDIQYTAAPNGNTITLQAPNPFAETMRLEYELAQAATVEAVITSSDGKRVATIKQGRQNAGKQTLHWNGRADDGTNLPAGAYFISLMVNEQRTNDIKVVKTK